MTTHLPTRTRLPHHLHRIALAALLALVGGRTAPGADAIFSGPQPSEKATPFKVIDLGTEKEGAERDPVTENAGAPTALVFVHGIERSLVPLLRVIDEYGALRKDRIRTEVVFLAADRLAGEQRTRAANKSLRLQSRIGLSPEGIEGPGNYGLNKECLMTVLTTVSNRVTANFALVQPGIADAPRVLEALARTAGDDAPPSVAELSGRRAEMAPARSGDAAMRRERAGAGAPAKEPFPGAVPTDERLQALLRRFIRATNDVATTDRILADVKVRIQDQPDLKKQAIDGWTRVLHFGDRYGNEYSRKLGREFLDELQKP
ncbi:MAG: hypothetical protein AB7O66_02020 [Limisphaerales bacterium]